MRRRVRGMPCRSASPTMRVAISNRCSAVVGDARLVEREANDVGSVSRGDGQNLVQDLLLAVDGIDDRLAGVPPDGGLERGGDGGVELERQCDGPREAFTGDL